MALTTTTLMLWPKQALANMLEKGLNPEKLKFSEIIFAWDDNYDQQRMLFETQLQERPLFIIVAKNVKEVKRCLNLCLKYTLRVRIVGGRHSTEIANPEVFLVTRKFDKISHTKHTLTVGAGLTQGQVKNYLFKNLPGYHFPGAKPLHPTGLFPGGSAASVGVAGISTVGGIGTLRRTYGLTVDSILSFDLVVPPTENRKAKLITASSEENSDLYWALRGGGANSFGVVVNISYKLLKVGTVIMYHLEWDWDRAEEITELWQTSSLSRPPQYSEDLSLYSIKGKPTISLTGFYVVEKDEKVSRAKKNITNELKPLDGKLTLTVDSYANIYTNLVAGRTYYSYSRGKTLFANRVDSKYIVDKVSLAGKEIDYFYFGLQLMGGKIAEVGKHETAFYARKVNFFVDIFNYWNSAVEQTKNLVWNTMIFDHLYDGQLVYLGFPIQGFTWKNYVGSNSKRLHRIKEEVDPLHVLPSY